MGRSLRERKQVDYRSKGIGADDPAWLKVTGTGGDVQQDEENLNPQLKTRHGRGRPASTGNNKKPAVLGDSKESLAKVGGKKRKLSEGEPATGPAQDLEENATGSKPKAALTLAARGSAEKAKDKGGSAKKQNQHLQKQQHHKGAANKRAKLSDKEPAAKAEEPLPKHNLRGSSRRADPEPPIAKNKATKATRAAAAAAADASPDADDAAAAGGEAPAAAVEAPAPLGCGRQAQKKPAGRGRNAGLIVEDLDEGKVAYPKGAKAAAASGAGKAGPSGSQQKQQQTAPPVVAAPAETLRPVRGIPGVSMRVPAAPLAVAPRPEGPPLPSAEEAVSWLASAQAHHTGSLRPTALAAPSSSRPQDNSAAFMKLQEAYVSLQDKYRSLKEGTLKDLEATLLASCGSMDSHLQAASKLAAHWKEEAQRQASLAQAVASPEIHNSLRSLKEESAALRTARLEAVVRLGEKEEELAAVRHAAELAEARAAAAEAALAALRQNMEDKATQVDPPASKEAEEEEAAEGAAEEGAETGSGAAESVRSGRHSSTHPGPAAEEVVEAGDGATEEEEDEEQEIVVLEICLNEAWKEGAAGQGAPATPCSLVRRRTLSRALLGPMGAGSGPVRVVFTASGPSCSSPLVGAAGGGRGGSAVLGLSGASPMRRRRLSGLVADAQEVLLEPTPKRPERGGRNEDQRLQQEEQQASEGGPVTPVPAALVPPGPEAAVEEAMEEEPAAAAVAAEEGREDSGALEALTGFRRLRGHGPTEVSSYVHEALGFAFELGPADSCSDSSAAGSASSGGSEEEEGRDLLYRPLRLGDAAVALPTWLKEPMEFSPSQRTTFFSRLTEALNKAPTRKHNARTHG